jgi:hypothetical protein
LQSLLDSISWSKEESPGIEDIDKDQVRYQMLTQILGLSFAIVNTSTAVKRLGLYRD